MEALQIQGLSKQYPQFQLRDVSFSVRQGEIMGLIGRNGAGKTTTFKSILNYVHPDSGDIRFFGLTFPEHEFEIKQRIGFVSGGVDYYVHKKLQTITDVTRRFYSNWDQTAYEGYLQRFQLDLRKTPAELSAGMKVKYNLALALSHHAELLILDEPTSGLDPVSRDDLLDIFLQLAKEGVGILFSTHITSDLDRCADRITYIQKGKILASENLDTFISTYRVAHLDALGTQQQQERLIGCKPVKHGLQALIKAEDVDTLHLPTEAADLETIMIHLEKE